MKIIFKILIFCFFLGLVYKTASFYDEKPQELPFTHFFEKNDQKIKLMLADDFYKIKKGLMYRKSLNHDEGMLFTNIDDLEAVWTKNMLFDIDIIFIEKNKIVKLHTMNACNFDPCVLFFLNFKFESFIELNKNKINELNLKIGDGIYLNQF